MQVYNSEVLVQMKNPCESPMHLFEDGAYTIHKERNICNSMQLCPESLYYGVQRFCRRIGSPVDKVVQDLFLF